MKNLHRAASLSLALACVMLIGTAVVHGQAGRSSISGFVFGEDRRPISDVWVELLNEYGMSITRVRTDGSGRYYFGGLGQGRFGVRVRPFGTIYDEATVDVEIAGIGVRGQALADNAQRDVYLKPRKNADSVPFRNETVFAQSVPKDAENAYNAAMKDIAAERGQDAVANLQKAIAIFPTYFAALHRLGTIWLANNDFKGSIAFFERAAAVNKDCFDCWYGIAFSQYALKDFDKAATAAEQAVLEKPGSYEANFVLGISYRKLKRFADAEKALIKAAKTASPQSPDVHWNLALLYYQDLKKNKEAAKELETWLKLSPEAPNKEDVKKLIQRLKETAQ